MNFYFQIALTFAAALVIGNVLHLAYLFWTDVDKGNLRVDGWDPSTGYGTLVWTGVPNQIYQIKVFNTQNKKTAVFSDTMSISNDSDNPLNYGLHPQCFPHNAPNASFYVTISANDITYFSDILTLTN